MTSSEFTKLMGFVMAAVDKPVARPTIDAYFEMLKDLSYDLAAAAVKKIIATDEYPTLPTIGKIRQAAAEISRGHILSAPEAWGMVLKAVHEYGYYREGEALASLPEHVAEVVRWMGFQTICMSEKISVDRGQFLRMYEVHQKREQEQALLPPAVRDMMKQLAGGMKMLGDGEK
ncbi:replicative helicase loader/inhibitor [Candidatus Darwinibacter acetoxidans]